MTVANLLPGHLSLLLLLLLVLVWRSTSALEQQPLTPSRESPLDSKFEALVERTLTHWHMPGLAICVIDGENTFAKGYGIAIYPDTSVTPETLFYCGSTTKSFTAAAVSLLIDETANSSTPLKWSTPLADVIREDFVLPDEYSTTHITFEDALSHRTGMPRHDASYGGENFTVRDLVRSLRYLPLTAEIRTTYQYCNTMFVAVSHAVETLTGMWLGDFLRLRIWEPLSMTDTFFSLADAQAAEAAGRVTLARGYFWKTDTEEYIPEKWNDFPEASGAGLIISNVLDYAKWLRAMINMSPPLSQMGHVALRTSRSLESPENTVPFTGPTTYTLGWIVNSYRGEVLFWHTGGVTAFGALMIYIPGRKWGVALMGNSGGTSSWAENELAFALIDDLLQVPENERHDWKGSYDRRFQQDQQDLQTGRERLYPRVPTKPLPSSLPLEAYSGLYNHPGYQNLTLKLAKPSDNLPLADPTSKILHADALDRTWASVLDFEHVSGEYFLMYTSSPKMDGTTSLEGAVKAEFRLGASGRVEALGIAMEPEMGDDKIWYKKLQ